MSIASPSEGGGDAWYLVIYILSIPLWLCINKYVYGPYICGDWYRLNYIYLTLFIDCMQCELHCYCGCWWPGDAKNQVINCFCIKLFHRKYLDLITRNIDFPRKWLGKRVCPSFTRDDPLHTQWLTFQTNPNCTAVDIALYCNVYHCVKNVIEICCPPNPTPTPTPHPTSVGMQI